MCMYYIYLRANPDRSADRLPRGHISVSRMHAAYCRLVLSRRELASDGERFADDARSSVGRGVRSVTKVRLGRYGGVFLLG